MSSIKTLKLNNYRNYKESIFNFLPNINIICGKNGVGKTNILESISLLSSGKGMLNSDAEEILNKESLSEQWSIFADINEDEIIDAITVYLDENKKKKVKLNGNVIKGREELNEIFNIVWVIPQMQNFFVEDRSVRRKFLDRCVYLLDVQHAKRVAKYEYYIKERIKILQNGYNDKWLNILEDKIVEVGNEINMARNNIINIFNDLMFTYNFDFPKIELSIENNDFNDLRKKLLQNRQKDRETKRTNDGVHKSDLKLFYKSKNIFAEYCSTGEQKLFLISLTLLRVFVGVEYKKGSPIVLLDEVFSYLDDNKKRSLFNELNKLKIQTFITTNNVDIFKELLNENVNLINLE